MFGNLVNIHDFVVLYEKVRAKGTRRIAAKFFSNKTKRVENSWQHTESGSSFWWDIPQVVERWNKLITGDRKVDVRKYVSEKYLSNQSEVYGISIGCGAGNREIDWLEACPRLHLKGYDISADRIHEAQRKVKERSLSNRLEFVVADLNEIDFPAEQYDVVISESALHHFSSMEKIVDKVKGTLKKDGLFIVDEYVGPARFQWTDRQLDITNKVLQRLPLEYRRTFSNGEKIKSKVFRPGRLSMYINDPSEAAESDRIPEVLQNKFQILESKKYGGTILSNLFKDIAHNFLDGSDESDRLLQLCFEREDKGMSLHEIESDFMFFVCRK